MASKKKQVGNSKKCHVFCIPVQSNSYFDELSTQSISCLKIVKKELESLGELSAVAEQYNSEKKIAELLLQALRCRESWMCETSQGFPQFLSKFLMNLELQQPYQFSMNFNTTYAEERSDKKIDYTSTNFKIVNGIYQIYSSKRSIDDKNITIITCNYNRNTFMVDYHLIESIMNHQPLHTFCLNHLKILKVKFECHKLLSEQEEINQQIKLQTELYKIDTHVHAAACLAPAQFVTVVKDTFMENKQKIAYLEEKGKKELSIDDAWKEVGVNPESLTTLQLGTHASTKTFQNFQMFQQLFNPCQSKMLRSIYLKHHNYNKGFYFAEVIKRHIMDNVNHNNNSELRFTIHGDSKDDWQKLAEFFTKNQLLDNDLSVVVQFPRRVGDSIKQGNIKSFQQYLENIFQPVITASLNPLKYPDMAKLLLHVVGFDSVDREDRKESLVLDNIEPLNWTSEENPTYRYYSYYFAQNIGIINEIRRRQDMNMFAFQPHCGEAGSSSNLICGFLLGTNIAHGLLLRDEPVLQYLYYLSKIGISMSPISNNYLYKNITEHPFNKLFKQGLSVTLSTDDPLVFSSTECALDEEYATAGHLWKLNTVDLSEIARNSVLISGLSDDLRLKVLGAAKHGLPFGQGCVPKDRLLYRSKAYTKELETLHNMYTDRSKK